MTRPTAARIFTRRHWSLLIVAAWLVIHLFLSYLRSFSSDEWPKYLYTQGSLGEALYLQLSELAPYAPGEIVIGFGAKLFFGWFLPVEVWSRLPALLFGALTVWLACGIGPVLVVPLIVFSSALTSFATQYQPYTAMMFGGALAFRLIFTDEKESKTLTRLVWFNLFFGHLYGICFVALAYFFRRGWRVVATSAAYVAGLLILHAVIQRSFPPNTATFPPLLTMARETAGALTNPHKVSWLLVPLAVMGFLSVARSNHHRTWRLAAFFLASIGAATGASYVAHYMFMPRQLMGAHVGVLALAAFGAEQLVRATRHRKPASSLATLVLTTASATAWGLLIAGVPPFVDQPLHRAHLITRALVADPAINDVLWQEVGSHTGSRYLDRLLGAENRSVAQYGTGDVHVVRSCWRRAGRPDFCLHQLEHAHDYFHYGVAEAFGSPEFLTLLNGTKPRFGVFVHSQPRLELKTAVPLIRLW